MKIEERIVSDLAYDLKQKIVSIVIEELKYSTKTYHIDKSGDYLTNLWEEFCVVVQDNRYDEEIKESIQKDIKNTLGDKFNTLSYYKKVAVWLNSKAGLDWLSKNRDNTFNLDDVPLHFDDCKEEFYRVVLKDALSSDSSNVYKFINLDSKALKEEFDEDSKENTYE